MTAAREGSTTASPRHLGGGTGWPGVPERPGQFHSRRRLLDLLDAHPERPLLLVSAPAGAGKTMLVADWVATRAGPRTEWLTLESDDAFWPGLVGSLKRAGVAVPAGGPPADGPLAPALRRSLALAVASEPEQVTVVVDGYDVDSAAVASDLDFLLRHSGHRLRLVLVTRADPVLPLYRYRLTETMTEVRLADLACDDDEAAALLRAMGLRLATETVHRLNEVTGGWVTGLRFAGRALAGRADPVAGVEQVVSHDDNIAEYLLGEVLATHEPDVRDLLLTLSVPDVIQPGLVEALAGPAAVRTLHRLEHENVFIEAVSGHPGHYRFHPLFRDLLRAQLSYRSPETMVELQRRAAAWCAEQGLLGAAVSHYAAAGAWEDAASLVVERVAVGELLPHDASGPLVATLQAAPPELEHPAVLVVRAALALRERDLAGFDETVARLDQQGDRAERGAVGAAVPLARGVLAAVRARGGADAGAAWTLAERAAAVLGEHAAEPPPEVSTLVATTQALAAVRRGDLDAATRLLEPVAAAAESGDGAAPTSGAASAAALQYEAVGLQALTACCAGDLARAEAWAARAVRAADEAALGRERRSSAADVALAWIAVERLDLRAAVGHVRAAERCAPQLPDPVSAALLVVVRASVALAQGDPAAGLRCLTAAIETWPSGDGWLLDRLHVELAQLTLVSGDAQAALRSLASVRDPRLAAATALVAAQARLALGDPAGAATALAPALADGAPAPVRVSAWLTDCARLLGAGSVSQARRSLVTALATARPATLCRPFQQAAPAVRRLITQDPQLAARHAWALERPGIARVTAAPAVGAPLEPLTEKEREVLGHLAELLTTEEIAATMYISVNTVRTHVRNILRKLGVSRRNAAVRMAREHDLLAR